MNRFQYPSFALLLFFVGAVVILSVFPSFTCFSEDHANVQVIKVKDFNSQDEVRDSIRFALLKVSDRDLSFWGREYPIKADFYHRGNIRSVEILKGHNELQYKLWMQEKSAPLVIVLPGIGSHFQGMGVNAMAQVYYNAGCSVAIISSTMNWEFYMAASRSKAPGYVPTDVDDLYNALSKIVADVKKDYPEKVNSIHLVGYSLGGLHTLFLAERESRSKVKIGFSSYLAIHPPVDPYSSMFIIDKFFARGSGWTEKEMKSKIEHAVAGYVRLLKEGVSDSGVKILKQECEVLIAYAYRTSLRELMLAICKEGNDMGFIKEKYGFTKGALYRELDGYSFAKYTELLVKKSVSERLNQDISMKKMELASNLHSIEKFLKDSENVSVIHSLDDFLIDKKDIIWFSKVFGKRAYFFRHGGHLGELYTPEARFSIVKHLNLPLKHPSAK